ncbi:MAG: toll/interleukin-1 receptor domain-containing protein [Lachnospiraceae bacterium]
MAKIFISHSVEDKEIVKKFIEFLQMGMGVRRDDIFCTSYPSALPTGHAFIEKIKSELQDCEAVMFIITENYLKSQFCIAELGAAWGLGKRVYPLLLVDFGRLDRTPLKGIQMRKLNSREDISTVYDELCESGIVNKQCTSTYMEKLEVYLSAMKFLDMGDYTLKTDMNGYYHTEIIEVRNVPREYRCYRIRGHIDGWQGEYESKTDWLFYRQNVYEDFRVGDRVCFKIAKMEEKTWSDIGRARNIYPADLRRDS